MKTKILEEIKENLVNKKQLLTQEMAEVQTSANSETKSSAGDKYETSRAMAQIEIDRLKANLYAVEAQLADVERISRANISEKSTFGSLVSTNQGLFLLGIGLGKIETLLGTVFAISVESPLGQQIKGKRVAESFIFPANNVCTIIAIA